MVTRKATVSKSTNLRFCTGWVTQFHSTQNDINAASKLLLGFSRAGNF
jgi:hypothetical protein